MARVEQIMQPSQRELFFTPIVVLVEGIEDIAFISTHLQLTDKWSRFRELGCHFVVAGGKSAMSRPLAVAKELRIPAFVIFDGDADQRDKDTKDTKAANEKDNSCILRLCGLSDFDPTPIDHLWHDEVVMWRTNMTKAVPADFGDGEWTKAEDTARTKCGFDGIRRKNNLLIAATLEELASQGKTSAVLSRLSDQILVFAQKAMK
jgi:hypothetical protein